MDLIYLLDPIQYELLFLHTSLVWPRAELGAETLCTGSNSGSGQKFRLLVAPATQHWYYLIPTGIVGLYLWNIFKKAFLSHVLLQPQSHWKSAYEWRLTTGTVVHLFQKMVREGGYATWGRRRLGKNEKGKMRKTKEVGEWKRRDKN